MAELGPFTSSRDEWSYRQQVDEERNELLYKQTEAGREQGIEHEPPTWRSVVAALGVVTAMVALLILVVVSGYR